MIRATLLARNQLKCNPFVAGYPVHYWHGFSTLKLHNGSKPVVLANAHRLYSAGGSGKPASVMAAGAIGMNDHGHPPAHKGSAAPKVRAPVTIMGKLDNIEPLETSMSFNKHKHEPPRSETEEESTCSEKQPESKKTDHQKKAQEAKEAAAKKLQDIVANLPSKQQTEKYFFRVVAFAYDLTYLTGTWMLHFIDQNIIRNEKVQHYWKRFHEKMEQAKKD